MDSSTPLILSELRQASDVLENFISRFIYEKVKYYYE